MNSLKDICKRKYAWLLFIPLDAICILTLASRYFINTANGYILYDGLAWTSVVNLVLLACVIAFCRERKRWIMSIILVALFVISTLICMYAQSLAELLQVPMVNYVYYPGSEVNTILICLNFCVHSILVMILAFNSGKTYIEKKQSENSASCNIVPESKDFKNVHSFCAKYLWIVLVVIDAISVILLLRFWFTGLHNTVNSTLYNALQLSGFYVPICFAIAVLCLCNDSMRWKVLIPIVIIIFDTLGTLLWSNNTEVLYGYSINPYPGPHIFTLVTMWNFYIITCTAFALMLHEYKKNVRLKAIDSIQNEKD